MKINWWIAAAAISITVLVLFVIHDLELSNSADHVANSDDGSLSESVTKPFEISNIRTYWLIAAPASNGATSICVPAVSFNIRNVSKKEIAHAIFEGTFLDPRSRTTYGNGVTYGPGVIPPTYSQGIAVTSAIGLQYLPMSCASERLPHLVVGVVAHLDGSDFRIVENREINREEAFFYRDELSLTSPPQN